MKNEVITIFKLMKLIKKGKAPEKIKYNGIIYQFNDELYDYDCSTSDVCLLESIFSNCNNWLYEEVEIQPKENNDWEDIEELKHDGKKIYNSITNIYNKLNSKEKNIFIPILNQLIKNQKYLKERLDKNELR